jgi:hypothetical protein
MTANAATRVSTWMLIFFICKLHSSFVNSTIEREYIYRTASTIRNIEASEGGGSVTQITGVVTLMTID